MSNDLKSILFPRDEFGNPAAVLYAQISDDESLGGEFMPVTIDPMTGALMVAVVGGTGVTGFVDEDGLPASAVVTNGSGYQMMVIQAPLPAGSNIIGKVIQEVRVPNFVMMHQDITVADETLIAPVSIPLNSYNATGCQKLLIHIDMDPGSSIKLRPVTWNPLFSKYVFGDPTPEAITEPFELELDVWGVENVYLIPTEVVGTVSVAVAGV
jgi:hypothetical protein